MSIKNFIKYLILNLLMVISLITFSNNKVLATPFYDYDSGKQVADVYLLRYNEEYWGGVTDPNAEEKYDGLRVTFMNEMKLDNLEMGKKCEIDFVFNDGDDDEFAVTFIVTRGSNDPNWFEIDFKYESDKKEYGPGIFPFVDKDGITLILYPELYDTYFTKNSEDPNGICIDKFYLYNVRFEQPEKLFDYVSSTTPNGTEVDIEVETELVRDPKVSKNGYDFYESTDCLPELTINGSSIEAKYSDLKPEVYNEYIVNTAPDRKVNRIEFKVPETAVYNIEVLLDKFTIDNRRNEGI